MANALKIRDFPNIEFCKIGRAAELLGCSIDDILHWAELRKIKICVKLHDFYGKLLIPAISSQEKYIKFLFELMNCGCTDNFIKKGNDYINPSPLISIYPRFLASKNNESEISDFVDMLSKEIYFPVSFDGIWELDDTLLNKISDIEDVILGCPSENMIDMITACEVLNLNFPMELLSIMRKISFIAHSPDSNEICGDYIFIGDILNEPLKIPLSNLYLTRRQMNVISEKYISNEINCIRKDKVLHTRITTKQSIFSVQLLKELGITDSDMKGSITRLRQRIAKVAPSAPVPNDDKSLIDWLKKGGIDR